MDKKIEPFLIVSVALLATFFAVFFINDLAFIWPYMAGYAFSIFAGSIFVSLVTNFMHQRNPETAPPADTRWQSRILGYIERGLYTATVYHLHTLSFVGLWLLVKTVAKIRKAPVAEVVHQSPINNIYLIGSLLSAVYGFAGARIISLLINQQWPLALGAAAFLVFVTLSLWLPMRVAVALKENEEARSRKKVEDYWLEDSEEPGYDEDAPRRSTEALTAGAGADPNLN